MASTNKYVPDELRNQILLSLPVKSLLRFRCVCKSWNRLISSKSFCYSHLAHNKSSSNTRRYLLFENDDFYTAYLINRKSRVDVDVETRDHIGSYNPKLASFESESCYLNVYGICNGILCLSDEDSRLIYLWNPIARRGKRIPNPYEINLGPHLHAMAFGYHNNDYKVIKMYRFQAIYSVYIYSLGTDDWQFVTYADPDYISHNAYHHKNKTCDGCHDTYMQNPNPMLVNGVAYFLKEGPCQVVCYDIRYNIIRTVNFPEDSKADLRFITMKAYGESIALLEYYQTRISGRIVMWILSGKLMWEKRFNVDLEDRYPVGFIDDGNIMVRSYNSNEIMSFNLETNQITELKFGQPFQTLEEWHTIWGIDSFVESLVLPDKSTMDAYFVKEHCSANTTAFKLEKWKI